MRSIITYGPYTSVEIFSRISNNNPLILMTAMSFSYPMRVCMNALGMSKVEKYRCYYASTIHVSRTDLVETVRELVYYLDIKSLLFFPSATVLPFRVPYLFYLGKRWESRIVFLYYLFKYFLCRGTNVFLIWSCLIYEWNAPLPFLPHFLMHALIESWVMMTTVTSGSFWNAPRLKNTWEFECRTSCYTICAAEYA